MAPVSFRTAHVTVTQNIRDPIPMTPFTISKQDVAYPLRHTTRVYFTEIKRPLRSLHMTVVSFCYFIIISGNEISKKESGTVPSMLLLITLQSGYGLKIAILEGAGCLC
jgi:hypothetical protein